MPSFDDYTAHLRRALPGWAAGVAGDAAAMLAARASVAATAAERAEAAAAAAAFGAGSARLAAELAAALRTPLAGPAAASAPASRAGLPPDTDTGGLSLVDEGQIDADIETFRLARAAEDACEAELRRLAPLCSRLQQREGVLADAVPLPPLAWARAARTALAGLALPRELRAVVTRELGQALAGRLRLIYAEQVRLLQGWKVEPAPYRVRQTVSAPAGPAARPAAAAAGSSSVAGLSPELVASLGRLVDWARRQAPVADDAEPAPLRLLAEPAAAVDLSAPRRSLGPAAARQLMQHLFTQVESQTGSGPAAAWLARLRQSGAVLAEHSSELWERFDHPWWQLLDKLLALAALRDLGAAERMDAAIMSALDRLDGGLPVERHDCAAAVAQIDRATSDWLAERRGAVGAQAAQLAGGAARGELEAAIREQIVARVRAERPPEALRRFVEGPWLQAMADTAWRQGIDSDALAEQADTLDALLAAGRAAVPREARHRLLAQVRDVLASAGTDAHRAEAELHALDAALRHPVPPPAAPPTDAAPPDLATVPIDMFEASGPTAASRDREAWLDGLAPGARCRLFLHDRWCTTELTWVSPDRALFVFGGGRGGAEHSLPRRLLEKLRNAGLAATLAPGALLAEAMDRVTDLGELGEL